MMKNTFNVLLSISSLAYGHKLDIPNAANNVHEPGVVVNIPQHGVDFLSQFGVTIAQKAVKDLVIPDFSFTKFAVEANVTGVKCDVRIGYTKNTITSDSLNVVTDNINAICKFDWKLRGTVWPHAQTSGTVTAQLKKSHLQLGLKAFNSDASKNYTPQLGIDTCKGQFTFEMSFGDTALEMMVRLLSLPLQYFVSYEFETVLCEITKKKVIPNVNHALTNFTYMFAIPVFNDTLVVNYLSTFKYEKYKQFQIGIDSDITIQNPVKQVVVHERPIATPEFYFKSPHHILMATVDIPFFLENAYNVFAKGDKLQIAVDGMLVEPLNTKTFKLFLPQIYQQFPDKKMKLEVKGYEGVTLDLEEEGQILSLTIKAVEFEFLVYHNDSPNSTLSSAFTLALDNTQIKLRFDIENEKNLLNLEYVDLKIVAALRDSQIGEIDMDWLNSGIQFAIPIIHNVINHALKTIQIPKIEYNNVGFVLRHPSIHDGVFSIAIDPQY